MPTTTGTVLTRAATHLNDPSQLVYTSSVLIPFLNSALWEVEEELAVYDVNPIKKDSATIDVAIAAATLAAFPADYISPVNVYERNRDSSDSWRLVPMAVDINKDLITQPATEILEWAPRGSALIFNPPTTEREVLLEYWKGLTVVTGTGQTIDIEETKNWLALLTARNAAMDAGNSPTKAASYEGRIITSKDRVVRRLQKLTQTAMGVRRQPFTGR